jgi:Tfp pilus assembly protein FimT
VDKKKALTLVELIVSISILIVIASGVIVSFAIAEGKKLEAGARILTAELKWARSQALSQNYNYVVAFTPNTYTICKDSDGGDDCDIATEKIAKGYLSVTIGDLIELDPETETCAGALSAAEEVKVEFFSPLGDSQDKCIPLSNGSKTKMIRIFADTGYIEVVQ